MCPHTPPCPDASAPDREAAHTIASHPEQGWSLLCNGIVIFEDTGELLPDGASIAPHRPTDLGFDRPARIVPARRAGDRRLTGDRRYLRGNARSGPPRKLPS